ncbi:Methyltransferase domain-containing protein [Rhodococcus triatomae]|uniref:Methyltransferase domain-containing protein n=1 Tax=Rhodococcus triatomae TaxID=300028 RepID=A0A1G8GVZ4_9NOCA|nr:class I SAM-dependent methyltransferase [Rhodococcus triatomae]SDH98451.1 Methyltransferase domain-containing protein [Rhodococcus triatomae]
MLTWDEYYSRSEPVWGAPPDDLLVDLATSMPRGTALDLGCGEGRNALWLATRGWQVTAVDSSPVAVTRARAVAARSPRSVRERLDFRLGSAADVRWENEYDLALVLYVHVPPPERRQIVNHAISALKPDGTLMISGYDVTDPGSWGDLPIERENLYDTTQFTEELADRLTISQIGQRRREIGPGFAVDAVVVGRTPILGTSLDPA